MKLATGNKDKLLPAIHPNVSTEARYQAQLISILDESHRSMLYWVLAAYRGNLPHMAMDASPAIAIGQTLNKLSRKWQSRFSEVAPKLAHNFISQIKERTDHAMRTALKSAGFDVKFRNTALISDAYRALVSENENTIKSFGQQYMNSIHGTVMRAVELGHSADDLKTAMHSRYEVVKSKIRTFTRHQASNAHNVTMRARQDEFGLYSAVWVHTGRSKEPRLDHVEAGAERRVYDIRKGCLISGEYIQPGQLYGCTCIPRMIVPANILQ